MRIAQGICSRNVSTLFAIPADLYCQRWPRKQVADYAVSCGNNAMEAGRKIRIASKMRRPLRDAPERAAGLERRLRGDPKAASSDSEGNLAPYGIRGGFWRRSGQIARFPRQIKVVSQSAGTAYALAQTLQMQEIGSLIR